ncbi:hypothetical protein [Asanoa siamensis]|uniref:Uncharacterized protein n=1 Tax=Asanoa siamensis TaxID=926357 RepID=A0ABQ4CS86_9ACTN|nr:hypothetical protein [Asanoa siamensis]GIF74150.1 hypothetical protein Asi02nite_36680 [Asanoa siamensis]
MTTITRHAAPGTRQETNPLPPAPHAGAIRYVPVCGALVVLLHPITTGWACAVITDPTGTHQPGQIAELPEREIEAAVPVEVVDPTGALPVHAFVGVWLARIWGDTHGGRLYELARVLALHVRGPGSRAVLLNAATKRRLTAAAHLRPAGLDNLLTRMQRRGFLTSDGADRADRFVLTLPPLGIANPCGGESAGSAPGGGRR